MSEHLYVVGGERKHKKEVKDMATAVAEMTYEQQRDYLIAAARRLDQAAKPKAKRKSKAKAKSRKKK